jgi:hypothetical protein
MIEDKKGRGTLSGPRFEVVYHLHREHEQPPNRPGVYTVEIAWVDVKPAHPIPNGTYVLTESDGTQHLVECSNNGGGWSYQGPFRTARFAAALAEIEKGIGILRAEPRPDQERIDWWTREAVKVREMIAQEKQI